ncbi:MAG: hypothetical protein RL077_2593 [Verrucomicrobiota bacterium]|jgi:PelA/Pel-15E family pectate lyase
MRPKIQILRFAMVLCGVISVLGSIGRAAKAPRAWPSEPQFLPVTVERLAALPAAEQAAWRIYLESSRALTVTLPVREAWTTPSFQKIEGAGIPGKHSRGLELSAAPEWYASAVAATVAERVVAMQSKAGGWTKGNDYTKPIAEARGGADVWSGGTLDNDATVWELRFLALAAAATSEPARARAWRGACERGLKYVVASQYPNGGFPQIYPLAGGYHDAITFNDDAMVQALELLQAIADGKPEWMFVADEFRKEAKVRLGRGLRCILAAQLRGADGQPTVWCQQHDALTLRPCAARNFEPVASCTNESASLVKFLMAQPQPAPEVVAAVNGAAGWLQRAALRDIGWSRQAGGGSVVARPGSPLLWARMYELGTDEPIFGDRDRTVHYVVAELSSERRAGYAWYGTWPAKVLLAFKSWQGGRAP